MPGPLLHIRLLGRVHLKERNALFILVPKVVGGQELTERVSQHADIAFEPRYFFQAFHCLASH
jgi:hypothetical protein